MNNLMPLTQLVRWTLRHAMAQMVNQAINAGARHHNRGGITPAGASAISIRLHDIDPANQPKPIVPVVNVETVGEHIGHVAARINHLRSSGAAHRHPRSLQSFNSGDSRQAGRSVQSKARPEFDTASFWHRTLRQTAVKAVLNLVKDAEATFNASCAGVTIRCGLVVLIIVALFMAALRVPS